MALQSATSKALYSMFSSRSLNAATQVQQMSRFQLCHECYRAEATAAASGVPGRGLPAGMSLGELITEQVEAIPPTVDEGNPAIESEFFDTRQVHTSTLAPSDRR